MLSDNLETKETTFSNEAYLWIYLDYIANPHLQQECCSVV
jgi:hypothetical protein